MLSEVTAVVAGEILLKVTVLLAIAWGLRPLVVRANVRWQVFYWRGVALAAALMPLVVLWGPTVRVPVLSVQSAPTATREVGAAGELLAVEPWLVEPADRDMSEAVPPALEYEVGAAVESRPVVGQSSSLASTGTVGARRGGYLGERFFRFGASPRFQRSARRLSGN